LSLCDLEISSLSTLANLIVDEEFMSNFVNLKFLNINFNAIIFFLLLDMFEIPVLSIELFKDKDFDGKLSIALAIS